MRNEPRAKRILVVDDEEDLCLYLQLLLTRKTSYQVEVSTNPLEALEMVKKGKYHLVLSDIRMPKMDGIELLRQIKTLDPNMEVVMLTGASSLQSAVDALQYRAYDYIEKPIQAERLLHTVGNALARQELSTELSEMVTKVSNLNRELKRRVKQQLTTYVPHQRISAAAVVVDALEDEVSAVLAGVDRALSQAPSTRQDWTQTSSDVARSVRRVGDLFGEVKNALNHIEPLLARRDLGDFVRTQVEEFISLYPLVKVDLKLPARPLEANIDTSQLGDALTEVFKNAVEAMGESGYLTVLLDSVESHPRLVIVDSGPGFSKEALSRAFEPLFTTRPTPSTGLGLAIARRMVVQLGGRLEIDNDPNGGAKVQILLR